MQCEAVLLGRSPADGALDATSLASLVRTLLVSRSFASRRYQIRCQDVLEFRPQRARRRRVDDEGFESDNDDDSSSTKSLGSDDTVSNSSSCCLVEDHVFKTGTALPNTGAASDSANSSGASDTDDLDYHKNGVATPTAFQRSVSEDGSETFPISEVVFCHTDPQFPKVAVWVVKKPGIGLETLVFECKNSENLKKLCSTFQETSRRSKLDQFTHTNRRKDVTTTLNKNVALSKAATVNKLKDNSENNSNSNTATSKANSKSSNSEKGGSHTSTTSTKSTNSVASTSTTLTPLSSVLVKSLAPPTAPKPQQQTIIRTLKDTTDAITQFSKTEPTPSFPKVKPAPPASDVLPLRAVTKPMRAEEIPHMSRFNLVQRTDGDGVTHIEISRGIREDTDSDAQDASGPSSILSIHTPDVGNFQASKTRFSKEIESVIRSDIDSTAGPKKDTQRQRQPAILVLPESSDSSLRKVWTSTEDTEENPPSRPERRRYLKKKGQAPEPPKQQADTTPEPPKLEALKVKGTQVKSQPKIVKGQFIRVSVDQPQPQPLVMPVIQTGWGYNSGSSSLVAYSPAPWTSRRKSVEDIFQASHRYHHQPKTRTYRSKSPPARPMAYRYIDTVPQSSSTLTKRLFGVSQKLKELGGSHYATTARRRNSIGELAYTANQQNGGSGGNLKSVIKKGNKGRMGEYQEPKKVTFSAYATVQVVD